MLAVATTKAQHMFCFPPGLLLKNSNTTSSPVHAVLPIGPLRQTRFLSLLDTLKKFLGMKPWGWITLCCGQGVKGPFLKFLRWGTHAFGFLLPFVITFTTLTCLPLYCALPFLSFLHVLYLCSRCRCFGLGLGLGRSSNSFLGLLMGGETTFAGDGDMLVSSSRKSCRRSGVCCSAGLLQTLASMSPPLEPFWGVAWWGSGTISGAEEWASDSPMLFFPLPRPPRPLPRPPPRETVFFSALSAFSSWAIRSCSRRVRT